MSSLCRKIQRTMARRGLSVAPVAVPAQAPEPASEPSSGIFEKPLAKEPGVYLVTPDGQEFGPATSEEKVRKLARESLGVARLPPGCVVNRIE
jgi:hypothetical protein